MTQQSLFLTITSKPTTPQISRKISRGIQVTIATSGNIMPELDTCCLLPSLSSCHLHLQASDKKRKRSDSPDGQRPQHNGAQGEYDPPVGPPGRQVHRLRGSRAEEEHLCHLLAWTLVTRSGTHNRSLSQTQRSTNLWRKSR
jgi:hypothetical protein